MYNMLKKANLHCQVPWLSESWPSTLKRNLLTVVGLRFYLFVFVGWLVGFLHNRKKWIYKVQTVGLMSIILSSASWNKSISKSKSKGLNHKKPWRSTKYMFNLSMKLFFNKQISTVSKWYHQSFILYHLIKPKHVASRMLSASPHSVSLLRHNNAMDHSQEDRHLYWFCAILLLSRRIYLMVIHQGHMRTVWQLVCKALVKILLLPCIVLC